MWRGLHHFTNFNKLSQHWGRFDCVYFLWRWRCVLFKRMRYESRGLLSYISHGSCDKRESSNAAPVPSWLQVELQGVFFPDVNSYRGGGGPVCFALTEQRAGSWQGWEDCKTGCVRCSLPATSCKDTLIITESQWSRQGLCLSKAWTGGAGVGRWTSKNKVALCRAPLPLLHWRGRLAQCLCRIVMRQERVSFEKMPP